MSFERESDRESRLNYQDGHSNVKLIKRCENCRVECRNGLRSKRQLVLRAIVGLNE